MQTSQSGISRAGNSVAELLAALLLPAMAVAEETSPSSANPVSANINFTTDYIFRGISQTVGNPAQRGGIDYTHSSGLYAGVWVSNIGWISDFNAGVSSSLELDTYFGFSNTLTNDFGYDVGFSRYNYPASNYPAGATKADTDEIDCSLGYKWLTAKYSCGTGQFLTAPGASGTNYLEVGVSAPLGNSGVISDVHAGRQSYRGTAADALALAGNSATYSNYMLGISREFSGYNVALVYTGTNSAVVVSTPRRQATTCRAARWRCPRPILFD